jgi:hypothetical protein
MLLTSLVLMGCCAVEPVPPPDTEPDWWVTWGNDFLGVGGKDPDDNRTNEVSCGLRVLNVCYLTLDDSMLTHLVPGNRRTGWRLDELKVEIGAPVAPGVIVGEGWRDRRDLGGERGQNWFHREIGGKSVAATYEGSQDAFLVYCTTAHEVYTTDRFGLLLRTQSVGATDMTLDLSQSALAVYHGHQWKAWVGPEAEERVGGYRAGVVRDVARFEQGLYLETGVQLGNWSFDTRYQFRSGDSVGAVTYTQGF